ncbi:MAG: hypothetical protein IKW39_02670 [Alphaproteobacteria bacterium]|nr:hypothetical protein [Alphaproteobacteria bacterium]
MEITNFKTFDEFRLYLNTHREKIPHWDAKEIEEFNKKVQCLRQTNPNFCKDYDNWVKRLELKEKARSVSIKIGNKKEEMYSKGYIKLNEKRKITPTPIKKMPSGRSIEI